MADDPVIGAVPMTMAPSLNVTIPVAPEGVVDVNETGIPKVEGFGEAESTTVDEA